MRLNTFFLFSFLILAFCMPAYAQEGDDPAPLILSGDRSEYPLGLYLELLEDPGGELTIEDVTSPEYMDQFVPSQVDRPNFGFTDSIYWVRLRLRNENPDIDSWVLDVGFENMHFVNLYSPSANSTGYEVKQTGAMRAPSTREFLYPQLIFELTLPQQNEETYYLRFKNGAPMILPLTLWKPATFFANSIRNSALLAIFLGAMIGLLSYNLFLYFSLRDINYLYLALLLTAAVIYEINQTSYLEIYVAPDLYRFKQHAIALASSGVLISLILFYNSFLSAKRIMPNIYRLNLFLLGLSTLLGLASFITSYHYVAVFMAPTIIIITVVVMISVVIAWRRGFRAARFLVIAMLGLLVCLLLFIMGRMGIIPNSSITENAFRFGFFWMAVCSSLALADRVNLLRAETEATNRRLQRAEHRLSQILEALPLGVVVYGKDFKPTFVNQRALDILGNPDQGIVPDLNAGRTLDQAMTYFSLQVAGSEQDYPMEKLPVYSALQGEPARVDDIEADLVDRRVPLEIWANPVADDAGGIEAAVVAFQDITTRKQAEKAQRTSEMKFRVVVENNFEGVIFMDRDRTLLYVSPSYEQLNGIKPQELIGQSGVGHLHPDDRARIAGVFREVLEQPGQKITTEYRIRHQNGSWIWLETNAINLLDDPRVQAVVLNSRNITERKETETALADYRQHLEQQVEKRTTELSAMNAWLSTLNHSRQMLGGTADLPQVCDELFASIRHLFNARSAFLLRWDDQDEQFEVEWLLGREEDSIHTPENLALIAGNTPPLQQEILAGNPVQLSADQAASMPVAVSDMFQKYGLQTILLKPVARGQSVEAVFGIVMQQPLYDITETQVKLIKTIALDLVNLIDGARLLDRAQALVVAEERNSLARELHDSVTQILFSASVLAESTPRIWEKDQAIARLNMEKLSLLLRGALAEMRTLLFELRSDQHPGQSLETILTALVESMRARTHVDISLTVNGDPELPEDVTQVFYRIAREALNNVIVHADADHVSVFTLSKPDCAELHIWDDGRGFNPWEVGAGHMGINIMNERVATIGGDLQIQSAPGQGTEVIVNWPSNGTKSTEHG